MKLQIARFFVALVATLFVTSCETSGPPASPTSATSSATSASASSRTSEYAEQQRPGLGTRWGETRASRVFETPFQRANASKPFAQAAIYYNDLAGVLAMAHAVSPRRSWAVLPGAAGALVSVGLRDQSGRFLPGLIVGDHWFVVGEAGRRYSIALRNRSDLRLEIVLSVDGLDVIDGRPASFNKRGYLVPPHGQLNVQGFRQSLNEVAAFRFGSVRESYANQKYGETRNVGVIGIALFNEAGTDPWNNDELRRRLKANPFPGESRFATPPQ